MRSLKSGLGRLLLVGFMVLSFHAPAWSDESCLASPQSIRFQAPLSRSLAELRSHNRLTIVAMGSSSTYGTGASNPSRAYPAVLQRELSAALPGTKIKVLNRGVPGEDLFEMLPRLDRDVIAEHPDLVILQLGTNFVLKRLPIEKFLPALMTAVGRIQKTGADIVLMDPQYSPWLSGLRDVDNVVRAMSEASQRDHVDLISRYAMMKLWAKKGQFSTANMLSRDGLHMNDASYGCLADTVSTAILNALRPSSQSQMVSTGIVITEIHPTKISSTLPHRLIR